MSNAETDVDQTAEEKVLIDDVADEALEASFGIRLTRVSTLAYGSYCFTCVEHLSPDVRRPGAAPPRERAYAPIG
jgi:hypothetical protein